jgi:hypothetical protein
MRCAASSPDWPSSPASTSKVSATSASVSFAGHRAAVGQQVDQAFGGQPLDGFAQRRARHVQLLAQFTLVELGAGRDAAFDQQLAQPLRHLVVQAPREMSMMSAMGQRTKRVLTFCMQMQAWRALRLVLFRVIP